MPARPSDSPDSFARSSRVRAETNAVFLMRPRWQRQFASFCYWHIATFCACYRQVAFGGKRTLTGRQDRPVRSRRTHFWRAKARWECYALPHSASRYAAKGQPLQADDRPL